MIYQKRSRILRYFIILNKQFLNSELLLALLKKFRKNPIHIKCKKIERDQIKFDYFTTLLKNLFVCLIANSFL